MRVLRFLTLAALAVWIGGLVVLGGFVAQTTFDVLQAHDPVNGRVVAGELFGAVLLRFQQATWIAGGAIVLLLVARSVMGAPKPGTRLRMLMIALALGATTVSALVLSPRIDAIRRNVSGPVAALPADDARRIEFGRLHGISTGLMGLTLLATLVVLWTETRDH